MTIMRDSHVRAALHMSLRRLHSDNPNQTLFVDELGLCGEVRVDVAVVNGALTGYELKSSADTLRRLPTQVAVYSRVLDFATLVVAENHIEQARDLLPEWWGLVEARQEADSVSLAQLSPAAINPSIDPLALAQLLWRDEVLVELVNRGLDHGIRSKPRPVLWSRLAQNLPLMELRELVRTRLKSRQGWRVVQ